MTSARDGLASGLPQSSPRCINAQEAKTPRSPLLARAAKGCCCWAAQPRHLDTSQTPPARFRQHGFLDPPPGLHGSPSPIRSWLRCRCQWRGVGGGAGDAAGRCGPGGSQHGSSPDCPGDRGRRPHPQLGRGPCRSAAGGAGAGDRQRPERPRGPLPAGPAAAGGGEPGGPARAAAAAAAGSGDQPGRHPPARSGRQADARAARRRRGSARHAGASRTRTSTRTPCSTAIAWPR